MHWLGAFFPSGKNEMTLTISQSFKQKSRTNHEMVELSWGEEKCFVLTRTALITMLGYENRVFVQQIN